MNRVELRDGWVRQCPVCNEEIRFTTLKVDPPTPFFYSTACSDVLLRTSDIRRVQLLLDRGITDDRSLAEVWERIAMDAPDPPCGGRFDLWANFRCPNCRSQIPYNSGIRDRHRRIWEHTVVLIDGASVVGDSESESWSVRIGTTRPIAAR